MAHSDCGWTVGVQVKLKSLENTFHTWALLRWWFTTKSRYIKCMHLSESRVTWTTSVPILVFLGISVLDLGPMYATDRRQTKASLNASTLWGRRHNNNNTKYNNTNTTNNLPVSRGSAYTVVRATQQVNGKWQFCGCQNSVTPEPVD